VEEAVPTSAIVESWDRDAAEERSLDVHGIVVLARVPDWARVELIRRIFGVREVNLGRPVPILALGARDSVPVAERLDEKTLEAARVESDHSDVFPERVATTGLGVY